MNFVRLTLILTIVEVISLPLVTLQQATGKIKNYQIVVGTMHMMNFPISLILLHYGFRPETVYIVAISLALLTLYARLFMLKRIVDISINLFNKEVMFRNTLVFLLMTIAYLFLKKNISPTFWGVLISLAISSILTILIGVKKSEFKYVITKIFKKK